MNPDLIPIMTRHMGGESIQMVDARHLHQLLGVGRDFSSWIKDRIEHYDFTEGVDFIVADISPNLVNNLPARGRPRIDYHLTLDMAKELAMLERTSRGRQVRLYFIDCEKQMHQREFLPTLATLKLTAAERRAINQQAWADVTQDTQVRFQKRRQELLARYGQARLEGQP